MINKNELLFTVDEHNQPVTSVARRIAHTDGIWHRTVGVWVINPKNQILCQKRSLKKDLKPGMWEAFLGGHLEPNDTYLTAAVKEIGEELGITINEKELIPYKVFQNTRSTHKEFQHVFALMLERTTIDFAFEKEEIDELRWLDHDEVRRLLVETHDPTWVHKSWDEEVLNWITTVT